MAPDCRKKCLVLRGRKKVGGRRMCKGEIEDEGVEITSSSPPRFSEVRGSDEGARRRIKRGPRTRGREKGREKRRRIAG